MIRSCIALVWFVGLSVSSQVIADNSEADKPALIVMVAIDQLRRDRLDASMPGGLGKILSGRNYVEGMLDHGITNTCPGHVVMLTGSNPGPAGVPGNSFIDRETFESRYCVDDPSDEYQVLGGWDNRSPRNINVTALGDWLKQNDSNSRVFSISGKDRAAISLAGQNPDGVYWYHKDTGRFTTSGYYAESLPAYIEAFNGETPETDGYMAELPQTWEHDAGEFRPDDFAGEREDFGTASGHPILAGDEVYEQIYRSPYLDQMTVELASRVAEKEKLGAGDSTDLLIVALSATDTIGHSYGPRSAEATDALKKVDLWLGELLAQLESQVGKGRVLIALSADHGVAELPEYKTEQGTNSCPDQGRISVNGFVMSLYWNIYKEFSFPFNMPNKLVLFGGSAFTINQDERERVGIDEQELLTWLDDYLSGLEIVERTWTRQQVLKGEGEIARLLRNSFVPERSGDLMVQLKTDCILFPDGGTTHGSVYDYDREVPVVFYGWGVEPGQVSGAAHSVDIGPTLADHIGIAYPAGLDGKVLNLRVN